MDGDGGNSVGQQYNSESDGEFDLPSVLARLDERTPTARRDALERIRETIDDQPERCLPTVPKLRAMLEGAEPEFHRQVAYCLAELAEASPTDVAPSVDAIASFVADHDGSAATADLLRCLAAVARERPTLLVDHLDGVASHLESDVPAVRAHAALVLARVAKAESLDLPRERLLALLRDGDAHVRENACTAVGYGNVSSARERLETLARDDPDPAVRERAAWALERL